MKQLALFKNQFRPEFGGSLLKGKRKTFRPLAFKKPLHLIFKATNSNSLLRKIREVGELLSKYSHRAGVKLHRHAIHADHIHLIIQVANRTLYVRWIRAVTSVLSVKIGVKWMLRPYSRVVSWGRDYFGLKTYLFKNQLEADLILEAHSRLEKFRERWSARGVRPSGA